jgi:hypothetical protein
MGPESLVHKITNVPDFLYGAGRLDLDAGKSISWGRLKGWALVMDFPASKSIRPVPYK